MGCNFPVPTYRKDGSPSYRPCGNCIGCRLEYSRQWAVRCYHEAFIFKENCFITLTYNEENLPKDGSLKKKELSNYIKRLRRKIEPKQIRFFGCGEYGTKGTNRPHYHLCLFGYDFPDKEIIRSRSFNMRNGKTRGGKTHNLYSSKMLQTSWKKGFTTLGDLTFESAAYVARYVTKKITGPLEADHYKGKQPEFALMSRMPGIGKYFFEKYMSDIYPKGFITVKGVKQKAPSYYDNLYKKLYPERFEELKKQRIKFQEGQEKITGNLRGYHLEKYRKQVTKTLERKLENG